MRIGMVAGEYPPMEGGVGAFTREVSRGMVEHGAEVHVFTRQQVPSEVQDGIQCHGIIGRKWGWRSVWQVRRWLAVTQPDIVNIQFQTAAFNMHPAIHWLPDILDGVPSVVTFHDLRPPYLFPKAGPIRHWIVRRLASSASAVIATDPADARTLADAWGVRNVKSIPIGSNVRSALPHDYNREAFRTSLGAEHHQLILTYFGFLNESKGALFLIDAVADLAKRGANPLLVMIGGRSGASDPTNAEYGRRVDSRIQELGLDDRVIWTGFISDEMVSSYFFVGDITVLPYVDGVSLRRGTLMAALAHGRAIVTTQPVSAVAELDGVVCTVPPSDSVALADAVLSLWRDQSRKSELEDAALRASQSFTWESIARRTLDVFQECITGAGAQC